VIRSGVTAVAILHAADAALPEHHGRGATEGDDRGLGAAAVAGGRAMSRNRLSVICPSSLAAQSEPATSWFVANSIGQEQPSETAIKHSRHEGVTHDDAITWETHSRSTLPLIRRNVWVAGFGRPPAKPLSAAGSGFQFDQHRIIIIRSRECR
jgi:hypothetical protein